MLLWKLTAVRNLNPTRAAREQATLLDTVPSPLLCISEFSSPSSMSTLGKEGLQSGLGCSPLPISWYHKDSRPQAMKMEHDRGQGTQSKLTIMTTLVVQAQTSL